PRIRAARRDRDPAHGALAIVRQQAGRRSVADELLHAPLVQSLLSGAVVLAVDAPPHAPAAAARSARPEQCCDIVPERRREWSEFQRGHRAHSSISVLARSKTASYIARVTNPVCVLRWLGWYRPRRIGRSGESRVITPCPKRGRGRGIVWP